MVMMVIAMKLTMMNMAIMIMILKAVIKLMMMMMKRRTTMMMMIGLPLRVPSRSLGFRAWDLDN